MTQWECLGDCAAAVAVAALPTFNIFAETAVATEAEQRQRQWQRSSSNSSSQLTTVKHVPHRLRHANDVSAHTPPKRRRRPKLQKQQQQLENMKRKEKKPQLERFTVGKQRQRERDAWFISDKQICEITTQVYVLYGRTPTHAHTHTDRDEERKSERLQGKRTSRRNVSAT